MGDTMVPNEAGRATALGSLRDEVICAAQPGELFCLGQRGRLGDGWRRYGIQRHQHGYRAAVWNESRVLWRGPVVGNLHLAAIDADAKFNRDA